VKALADRQVSSRELVDSAISRVQVTEHAALRAPVALLELHAGVKRAAEHAIRQ
jgi:hypothetical protein